MFSSDTVNILSPMSTITVVILLISTFLRGREREGKRRRVKEKKTEKGEADATKSWLS